MNQGSTIYFAGAEVETLTRALLDNGVKNILYSYFYILQMRRERFVARTIAQNPDVNFFLDSGAFTYYQKWQTDATRLPNYEQYVRRYFSYIDEYGEGFCRVTEPDLDKTLPDITLEKVNGWREEMLLSWPDLNIVPVWHWWRGADEWNGYCRDDRIRYLSIGRYSGTPGSQRKMVMHAMTAGKPVHGFGQTKVNTLLRYVPYDSVDSTTWLTGQQYGTMYVFKGGKFITLAQQNDGKRKRRLYRRYFEAQGCDWEKIKNDDVAEVRKANVIGWRLLADRMEEIKRRRETRPHGEMPELRDPGVDSEPVQQPRERTGLSRMWEQVGEPKSREGVVSRLFARERDASTSLFTQLPLERSGPRPDGDEFTEEVKPRAKERDDDENRSDSGDRAGNARQLPAERPGTYRGKWSDDTRRPRTGGA